MEAVLGSAKFLAIYCVTGVGGNLFSALAYDSVGIGASTSIFGYIIINKCFKILRDENRLLGAFVGLITTNWSYY